MRTKNNAALRGTIVEMHGTWGFIETDYQGTKIFFERRSWKGRPDELRNGIAVQFEIKLSYHSGKYRQKAVKIKPLPEPAVEPDIEVDF